jgi:catechol 2,3-dioxygenase-like lactoylglutathione lyase family enzyme
MIQAIHHVEITIPRGAESQARKFYCGVLGLKEIDKPDSLAGRDGFWLQAGSAEIHVAVEDDAKRDKTRAHVGYEVENLVSVRQRLLAAGLEIRESIPIAGYVRFETRDPFGNRLEFLRRVSPPHSR